MNRTLTLPAPAKLNLMLHITGRREDGYHNLQTVFQLLDRGDQLSFTARDDSRMTLTPAIEGVPFDDNLIIRAAKLLQKASGCHTGIDIHLDKKLPMGGGIGGGSSNAATTLVGLNHLWRCGLNIDELAELGRQLGADVPVFVRGHSAWAEGVGEHLQPLQLPESWFLVLTPDCHVSTAEIFCHKRLTRDTPIIKVAAFFEGDSQNDCQPLVRDLYPEVDFALTWLSQYGNSRMTGTGASVFAAFDSEASAQAVLEKIPNELSGFVAKGVNISPLQQQLI